MKNRKIFNETIKLCTDWNILELDGDNVRTTEEFKLQRITALSMLLLKSKEISKYKKLSIGINMLTVAQMCKVITETQMCQIIEVLEEIAHIPDNIIELIKKQDKRMLVGGKQLSANCG